MLCQKKNVTSQRATGIIQSSILIYKQESSEMGTVTCPDSVSRVPSSFFPELSQLGAEGSSLASRGYSQVVMLGVLIEVASFVAEHWL